MDIDLEVFFPCSVKTIKDFKKKIIDITIPETHRADVISQIKEHLRQRVNNKPEDIKLYRLLKEVESWH